jgi:8-oxo-dGTP pyrophosphatase MutT (NUDIX family)
MIKQQYSAGVVVYRSNHDGRIYLLLHYPHGHWDLPKGKMEPGESQQQAALRELFEETGIQNAVLHEGFIISISYMFSQGKQLVRKTVYYFIAKTTSDQVTLSEEHIGHAWLPYEQAIEQLTFANAKEVLGKAEQFLNQLDHR